MNHGDIAFFYEKDSLISIANDLTDHMKQKCPLPLRRTFSLMREFRFKTIFITATESMKTYESNKYELSCCKNSCGIRTESCKDYVYLLEKRYKCKFEGKLCYKISFFDTYLKSEDEIKQQSNSNLLAYCILHRDRYIKRGKMKTLFYVTESTVKIRDRRKSLVLSSNQTTIATIAGKKFRLKGHYFCQQNSITNCCAQASIKMALRGFYKELNAEHINQLIGIDHINLFGNKGLEPKEFKDAILKIPNVQVRVIDGMTSGPWVFTKLIYHAIESKFPVILLFSHPKSTSNTSKKLIIDGHATALIGYTFNNSNWWCYGLTSYYSSLKTDVSYLPSILWADNFIIQDDNLGPYYRIPISSLRVTNITSKFPLKARIALKWVKKEILRHIIPFSYWPTYAVIIHPKDSVDFKNCLNIENYAIEQLVQYTNEKVINTKYEPKDNQNFSELFLYFLKEEMLIARTFAIKKCEYIEYYGENYRNENMEDLLDSIDVHIKTEYIWLTEVSVPELFWVNRMKLCDIISQPFNFPHNKKRMVKFIRMPSHYCFFIDGVRVERDTFYEKESRYPLVSPDCYSCFI